ncbi:leucyl/phenylalanyl-tRNA--protein transferase [Mariprofundus erugo]|uniref:Leucyl/phenylalanyl-tRNA--protein transferase n=1 Tax=Mariprofundus erugo TaxID=2528639 RepID=A0A5R9GS08_9PROT|nr:leucyl/phenylalanyl-tRNA--protein transferase [Mariprofundus erugo]TLS67875.1 leucyl/phenylalanyl-tRNA--protein transferase [Mariprofundus erugo]
MITFPDPELANDDGLLAAGGNLEPETLLAAYSKGIFPWYAEGDPVLWWAPDPRMVLFPAEFHCSRRLARRLRQYRLSWDEAFADVIGWCAGIVRKGETGTWILPEMIGAYQQLHALGHAHSVEVWQGNELVGGLYGVLLHGVFFAESMFSRTTDGSKMALAHLISMADQHGWVMVDCQFHTDHLASLGAREISRRDFMQLIGS